MKLNKYVTFIKQAEFKNSANIYSLGILFFSVTGTIILFTFYRNLLLTMPCPVKSVTGVPCPTCGSTRFALSLMDLRFKDALIYNPLFFTVAAAILINGAVHFYLSLRKFYYRIVVTERGANLLRILLVVMILLNWFYEWRIFPLLNGGY